MQGFEVMFWNADVVPPSVHQQAEKAILLAQAIQCRSELEFAALAYIVDDILREASVYDVAIYPSHTPEGGKRCCRLSLRAWIPNFGQRIFGLTFSNLMDCKKAILSMLALG